MITTPNTDANITEIHASLPVQKEKGKTIDFFDARKMMIENLTQKVDTSQEKLDSITDKINQIIKDAEARGYNLFDGTGGYEYQSVCNRDATTLGRWKLG